MSKCSFSVFPAGCPTLHHHLGDRKHNFVQNQYPLVPIPDSFSLSEARKRNPDPTEIPGRVTVRFCAAGAAALGREREAKRRTLGIPCRSWHSLLFLPFLQRLCSRAVSMVPLLCLQTCLQAALFSNTPHKMILQGGASRCVAAVQSCSTGC